MAKERVRRKQTQADAPAIGVPREPGWEPVLGVWLRLTLRGHEKTVFRIAWSPDGRRLASASGEDDADQLIHIWELDYAVLLGRGVSFQLADKKASGANSARKDADGQAGSLPHDSVLHATAKIVLVGDSGVGKTGLGWRLAHGKFKEHASTHGQQFWVLDQLNAQRADGTRCEAVLWDLAGQPDYRLIHALHVADADLAVILFDPTHARDPLGSVHYWLGQLPTECPKILVPARFDRGSPTLTTDAEMLTAVERVASHGYVRMLNTSDNQTRILLVPELLNNLAASVILEARRNPKGLGAIEEQRILDEGYDFPELDWLNKSDHDLLIDATIAAFLANRLSYRCFRDQDAYFIVAFDLMLTLYGVSFSLPGIKQWRQTLRGHRHEQ